MVNLVYLELVLLVFFVCFQVRIVSQPIKDGKSLVHVGVVLDLNSSVGAVANICISQALSDFYAKHSYYKTRLFPHIRDSSDVAGAALAALNLTKNEKVHTIIGPQKSSQAQFVIELGQKAQVPIISFSATSPSLDQIKSPFFVRTAPDDDSQIKAIVAMIQAYGWREVVPIYEDTDYGNGLIPYLIDALGEIDIKVPYRSVISPFSEDIKILKELNNLMTMQTRVFVVHMTSSLGARLFQLAKEAGMMSKGYAWLITYGFSTLLEPMSMKTIYSMQGVLGLKPYIPMSKKLYDFRKMWNTNENRKPHNKMAKLNLFGLWAYDTIWALAQAVEMVGQGSSNTSKTTIDFSDLGNSEMGPKILSKILNMNFKGLSGEFNLVMGQLQVSAFQIFNIVGNGKRVIGYWTPTKGLSHVLDVRNKAGYTTSMDDLKQPIWPGGTTVKPNGWIIPAIGKELRIGVPVKQGFKEFSNVVWDPHTNEINVSGFGHDVFMAVLDILPFPLPHKFFPFVKEGTNVSAGTYDQLLEQIKLKNYDAVVGDTTILAKRSIYVDFTLPYSESGVSMIVSVKDDERSKMWTFLKPLTLDLWLTAFAAFIFTGLVIWVLEHRVNAEFRGPPKQQIGLIFWFSFSTLVFAHKEKVVNNWSRLVLIVWVFVVLILSQSYTASLASYFTAEILKPNYIGVEELQKHGLFVGYKDNSFVRNFLIEMGFHDDKLRPLSSEEEYDDALSKGSDNHGVSAIFDGIPYISVFLSKYGKKYRMVGPSYKVNGFGFAFPLGSPLVPYISRAILNVTEDKAQMDVLVKKYSMYDISCQDQFPSSSSNKLSVYNFGGLFLITGITSISALLIFIVKFLYANRPASDAVNSKKTFSSRIVELAKHFDQKDYSWHGFKTEPRVHPVMSDEDLEAVANMENPQRDRVENVVDDEGSDVISSNEQRDMSHNLPNSE